jgi:hypothetical protein
MTIFLAVLTMLACFNRGHIECKGDVWIVPIVYALHALLVLGLAALTVWTWQHA